MINKIDGSGPIRTPPSIKRVSKSGGDDGFAKQLDDLEEGGSPAASSGASGVGLVSGIWGLQEVDDATARASRGKLRAENILDQLEDLKLDLLAGAVPLPKLHRLIKMVSSRRETVTDPHLAELLDEIDLRAQVELAKYMP